jgi:uncharacterized protein (DUF488 family)
MEIYTIGFTQTTAESFFGRLKQAGIGRILDVRLNNSSQLAGFAKARDLPYFLHELVGATYEHESMLAPTKELLDAYKKQGGSWGDYEREFIALMRKRRIEVALDPASFATPTALLCSEAGPEHCHRRLVCDYLAEHWTPLTAVHL